MSKSSFEEGFYTLRAEWLHSVWQCAEMTTAERLAAGHWGFVFVNRDSATAYVSSAKLAGVLHLSAKTVDRTFKRLEALGFIESLGYKGRARVRRMIFRKDSGSEAGGGDFSHWSPKSDVSVDTDFGQSDARLRTSEGRTSDAQFRQTIEPIEPSEGAEVSTQNAGKLASGSQPSSCTFEQIKPFWRQQYLERWEKQIRGECHKKRMDGHYRLLRDEDKQRLAWSMEFGHCKLADVVAEVRKLRNARSGSGRPTDTP